MSAPLSKLVLDYLKRNAGRRSTVSEIALALVDEHPTRFKAKGELGSKSALVTQITREIYARFVPNDFGSFLDTDGRLAEPDTPYPSRRSSEVPHVSLLPLRRFRGRERERC